MTSKTYRFLRWFMALSVFGLLGGCLMVQPKATTQSCLVLNTDGTSTWKDEFQFVTPPPPWKLIQLDEDDYSLAFLKLCSGMFPCQSTLAYAEEPFGYDRDLEKRAREFFKRFLWASRVQFGQPRLEKTTLFGQQGLIAYNEGIEPAKGHKVFCKIIFGKRGERVVAFYFTQWRPGDRDYDLDDVKSFDQFVESFRYLKPSFYETL